MTAEADSPRYASWFARVGAALVDILFCALVIVVAMVCVRLHLGYLWDQKRQTFADKLTDTVVVAHISTRS